MRPLILTAIFFILGLAIILTRTPKFPPDEVGDWEQTENVLGEASVRSCPGISFLDVLLDKATAVPPDYVPFDLVTVEGQKLRSEAVNQYALMKTDAQRAGYAFSIYSGFRTFKQQTNLHQQNPKSAPPGHSEHQLGTAVDLSYQPKTWGWLDKNAHKYGFVMSYRGTQQDQTKYDFEPWHWRFVGIKLATQIRQSADLPQKLYRKIICD